MTRAPADTRRPATAAPFLADVELHLQELLAPGEGVVADAARESVAAGGKRLRPLLVWAARPTGADAASWSVAAVRCATAVELVHTATLIHDDVLDRASERRGRSTVVAAHGREAAVAAGDLLFARAFATLVDLRLQAGDELATAAVQRLAVAARSLAEGEALQSDQQRDVSLDEAAYLRRCRGKTGVLFGAALALGALAGGADVGECDLLDRFGTDVGTAFQIADDILDLADESHGETLGKQPHADLRDGTITLPMVFAMREDPSLVAELAAGVRDTADIARRIRTTAGIDEARGLAEQLLVAARETLSHLSDRFDLDALDLVADQAVHRLS